MAQAPNPAGISGSFTTVINIENVKSVYLARPLRGSGVRYAKFVYKFSVSDSCRVQLVGAGDSGFSPFVSIGAGYDDKVSAYIPVKAGVDYSFSCSARELRIYRAGASATIVYTGVVEYE